MADHLLVISIPRGGWYDFLVTKLERIKGMTILAEYIVPSETCTCNRAKSNVSDWERGKMSGVPVCKVCRKPSPSWRKGILPRLEHALGRNQREA